MEQIRITPPYRHIRLSNIELLRIISMFLVMLVHSMEGSLGRPNTEELASNPMDVICRVNLETFGLVCVNVFVLISGWFGIKPSLKGAIKFIYQCIFMAIIIVTFLAVSNLELSLKTFAKDLCSPKNWWFVYAYFILYIMSPILNTFVENSDRKAFRNILIIFFTFQTIYGFLYDLPYFANGYSPLSFLGLYLLSQYIHKYEPKFSKISCMASGGIYLGISVGLSVLMCLVLWLLPWKGLVARLFDWYVCYTSPLNILASVMLLLCFSKMHFQSKLINSIAASSFAVYLLHNHPSIHRGYFKPFIIGLHQSSCLGGFLLELFFFLIIVFLFCVLVDKLRVYTYNKIRLWLKV